MADERKPRLKIPQELLPGVYANQMMVRHTREEFLIDFINRFPPRGVVAARVIVSPGHLKRMIGALESTLGHYEQNHGKIEVGAKPAAQPLAGQAPAAPGRTETKDDQPGAPMTEGAAAAAMQDPQQKKTGNLLATVSEKVLGGVYANQMMVSHTREEFLLDFVNVFPPQSVVTARVFVSPVQIKRMIHALKDNFMRYEAAHGSIRVATVPRTDSFLN